MEINLHENWILEPNKSWIRQKYREEEGGEEEKAGETKALETSLYKIISNCIALFGDS